MTETDDTHARRRRDLVLAALAAVLLLASAAAIAAEPAPATPALPTPAEAKARARLVHASMRGALEVMHRDFFRRGDSKAIPSQSLQDVFKAMEGEFGVTLHWLAARETVMNVDHQPKDAFQEGALKAVAGGAREYSAVEGGTFRFAGAIVLGNQCLKCHVASRTSLEDRFAALEITMPVRPAAAAP